MQQELQRDLFQAQTGTTVAQAEKFAQAAGEAYANVFGESIEGNLGTVKAALANGLLDPGATQRDAEAVISSLDGVATILGEDIPNVARAAGNAVKSGFATDVNDAFDLLVKGGQMGLNASEDLVDTVTEYSVQFEKVGLSGAEAFGLMNQAVQAGARDTDTAADAIKEFAIRSIDGSKEAGEAYSALGMNAEDMIERIGRGGEDGSAAMGDLLTAIRQTEDPIARNAIAVGLFGTKAEDLGNAMNELDLTSAMQSMNDYEGAAKSAIDVMGGNAATSVEGAMRSISTVADGLKASLAEAFGPQIAEWANNISNNRAGVIEFFIGIGNAGFDAAKAVASFVADGMRMLGEFAGSAAETGASFLDMGANILAVGESIPGFGSLLGIATDGAADKLRDLADSTRNGGTAIEDALTKGATVIDDTLIPGIDAAQERFNGFAGDMQLSAAFNDEIQKVNDAISSLGEQADGTILQLEGFTGAAGDMLPPGLADQLRGLTSGFEAQTRTGLEAGATVEELTAQYAANRGAILDQAMAMGLTNTEALNLINSYGLVPDLVDTQINQPGMPEATVALDVLKDKVIGVPNGKTIVTEALTKDSLDALSALNVKTRTLEDGTVEVYADTDEGQVAIDNFISNNRNKSVSMFVELQQRRIGYWESQGVSAADAPSMQGPVPTPISAPGRAGGGEFADGGAITGAGGPRSDNIPLWASPGEHMLDAEDVKNLGGQAGVYRFRAALENGQVGAFADGGAIGNRDAAISYAQSKNGMPYEYGKLDCSGYWSGIFNAYTGQSVRFTTDSDFAALGFQPGFDPGGFNIGTNGGTGTNGHMAGTLFGTDAESGSSGIVFGAGAQGAQDFPMVWHYPTGDDPATEALTGDSATGSAGADGSGGGSSTTGSNGARGGDVRDVFVTNWPSSAVSSKPSSGGSGGGSPQAGGAAAKAVDTESTPQARIEGVLDGLRQAVNQLAEQDSTGLVSLANGQYTSKIRENFGVEESSPLVRGALGQIPPTDVIPAMLTPGEVVIPKAIADKYPGLLDMLRHDAVGAYAEGGTVGFFGPTDRAFEAGGSKHADTVKQWSSAQADSDAVGSGAPLTVLKQATAGQLAAQEMYKGLVGFAGLAGFASEEFKSLLSGGILNLGQETVQQLVEGFRNAAQEIPPSGDTIQGDQINGDVVTQQGNDPGAVIRNAAASIGLRL
nr:phage tail tape measure protein [Rhodococcus sp. (in: high G+C Gram-positive bacteria)]